MHRTLSESPSLSPSLDRQEEPPAPFQPDGELRHARQPGHCSRCAPQDCAQQPGHGRRLLSLSIPSTFARPSLALQIGVRTGCIPAKSCMAAAGPPVLAGGVPLIATAVLTSCTSTEVRSYCPSGKFIGIPCRPVLATSVDSFRETCSVQY